MLMLLSHLIPLPTPDSADSVEQTITTASATNSEPVLGSPSTISHAAPLMLYKPEDNDARPSPMVSGNPRE